MTKEEGPGNPGLLAVISSRAYARWLLPATLATTAAATTAVATAAAVAATRTATAARTTTAAAAAVEWGFWHFGEFSRAYKECFGELPSETLRRRDDQPPDREPASEPWQPPCC